MAWREGLLSLGVAAERLKLTIFVGAALLTASVVAFVGPIVSSGSSCRTSCASAGLGQPACWCRPRSSRAASSSARHTVARNVVARPSCRRISGLLRAPFFIYLLAPRYRANL